MTWVLWAIALVVQNASFTLVSRARNSNSIRYHAVAAVGSNGVWFISQFILISEISNVIRTGSWLMAILLGVFYSVFTIIGSVGMHWLALEYVEKDDAETPAWIRLLVGSPAGRRGSAAAK